MIADPQLWTMFKDEASETLESLADAIDGLATTAPSEVAAQARDAMRTTHNLKGSARLIGVNAAATTAHAMEDVLALLRSGGAAPSPEVVAHLRRGLDLLWAILEEKAGEPQAAEYAASFQGPGAELVATPAKASAVADEPAAAGPQATHELTTVRIEAARLDSLMHFAGEFMSGQGRLQARLQEMERPIEALELDGHQTAARAGDLVRDLQRALHGARHELQRFGHVVNDWSAAVKRARMLPLSGVVGLWRRTVRELDKSLKREVRFVAEVGDLELDRQILDSLRDPMTHLLRNAVDHGIEKAAERKRRGKPAAGTIRVKARSVGTMVELEVSDDGRGLDAKVIGRRAVERGLVDAERLARMTAAEIQELIFAPGFSTAETVTEVSGRGVGLDVVRRRLLELGGQARIAPPTLGGTTFRLEVPATVVSTKGLLVRTHKASYILPTAFVSRTLRVTSSEVQRVDGGLAVHDQHGEPLRLRWLATLMGESREADTAKITIVVVSDGASRRGIVVEEIVAEVESVTKRLPWNVPQAHGVAGAMVLPSGEVAVVLDVPRLVATNAGVEVSQDNAMQIAPTPARRRVLVVDDSLTSRTLERNILTAAGYEVEVAVDGELAWQVLQDSTFALVVSDVEMPKINGLELTRRIRGHAKLKNTPVILVTSLDKPNDLAQGAAAGANEYVVKGRFDQRTLLDAVARLL
jgi:two-component system, chemotaxis family, sensor kinase CheA